MKKVLTLLVASLTFFGCNNDPENDPPGPTQPDEFKMANGSAVAVLGDGELYEYVVSMSNMTQNSEGKYNGPGECVSLFFTLPASAERLTITPGAYKYSEEAGKANTILYCGESYLYEIDGSGSEDKNFINGGEATVAYSGGQYTITGTLSFSSRNDVKFEFKGALPFSEENVSLEVSDRKIEAKDRYATYEVGIESNSTWTAVSDKAWCEVTPASGTGNGTITVTVMASDVFEPREAELTVSVSSGYKKIKVTQDASADLCDLVEAASNDPDDARLAFESYISKYSYAYDINEDGKLSAYEAWLVPDLSLFNYKFTHVDFLDYFPNVEVLVVSRNPITTFSLRGMDKLSHLEVEYTETITGFDMAECKALKYINFKQCPNLALPDLTAQPDLDTLVCDQRLFVQMPENIRKKPSVLYITDIDDAIGGSYFAGYSNLIDLQLSIGTMTGIDISSLTGLLVFKCYFTDVTSIDITGLNKLQVLDCQQNLKLASLDISTNTALRGMNMGNTAIASIDFTNNTNLEQLYMNRTKVNSVDVSMLTKLTLLSCYENGIEEIDISKNTALTQFSIEKSTSVTPTVKTVWVWDSFNVAASNTKWTPRAGALNTDGEPIYKKISTKP